MGKMKFTDCIELVGSACPSYKGEKNYISTGAIAIDKIDADKVEVVSYKDKPSRANLVVDKNTIIFAKMQATKKTLLINEESEKNIYSTGFCAVKPKETIINSRCLYHLLMSKMFLEQKDKNCSGATQKAITNAGLDKIYVTVPPLEMQTSIAEQLDKILSIINIRQLELSYLDNLIKARFVELFGDPLHPVNYKNLGEVALLERGRFSPRPRNDPKYFNGSYPFIQTGDISSSDHRLMKYKQTLNDLGITVSKQFVKGTIVMAIVGATIGATAILERDVYAPDSVIGITPYKYNNIFLETLLQFWQPKLLANAPECARANINLAILEKVPIVDVDIMMQKQFAAFVKQVDKSKVAVQKSLEETQLLFDSLMQKYFG